MFYVENKWGCKYYVKLSFLNVERSGKIKGFGDKSTEQWYVRSFKSSCVREEMINPNVKYKLN